MSQKKYSPEIEKIRRAMEKELSAGRYIHTLGVAYTASCLAMAHGIDDLESTMTSGLLHDCAKAMWREGSGATPRRFCTPRQERI